MSLVCYILVPRSYSAKIPDTFVLTCCRHPRGAQTTLTATYRCNAHLDDGKAPGCNAAPAQRHAAGLGNIYTAPRKRASHLCHDVFCARPPFTHTPSSSRLETGRAAIRDARPRPAINVVHTAPTSFQPGLRAFAIVQPQLWRLRRRTRRKQSYQQGSFVDSPLELRPPSSEDPGTNAGTSFVHRRDTPDTVIRRVLFRKDARPPPQHRSPERCHLRVGRCAIEPDRVCPAPAPVRQHRRHLLLPPRRVVDGGNRLGR